MSTYLQLCQALVTELGLSGGTPTTLTSVTGNTITELNNVTRWIHDAALQIDNLWQDWKYLWKKYTVTQVANDVQLAAPPTGVIEWDLNKIRWRPTGVVGAYQPLQYWNRQKFLELFDPDNATPGPPTAFTINPDNALVFAAPLDASYDFLGEYWQRPIELLANGDIPLMPAQHHRVIMCRAAVMYGNREDAPEVISGLEAEYVDMIDKLQSDQLEGFSLRRTSTDRERDSNRRGRTEEWLQ